MFSSGKHALGICDICGFEYKLKELREVYQSRRQTGLKACPTCWDPSHPQLDVGRIRVLDPEALRNPRTDVGEYPSMRALRLPMPKIRDKVWVGQVQVEVT